MQSESVVSEVVFDTAVVYETAGAVRIGIQIGIRSVAYEISESKHVFFNLHLSGCFCTQSVIHRLGIRIIEFGAHVVSAGVGYSRNIVGSRAVIYDI